VGGRKISETRDSDGLLMKAPDSIGWSPFD